MMLKKNEFELCSYYLCYILIHFDKCKHLHSNKLDLYKRKSVYLYLLNVLHLAAYGSSLIAVVYNVYHSHKIYHSFPCDYRYNKKL